MKPKLADVAKEAGVSPTTVSRVINDHGYLSNATKDKVHAAMDKLNYQPNSLARSLHGKKTNLIGVIFPSITNPFYAELIKKLKISCLTTVIRLSCVTPPIIRKRNGLTCGC